MEIKEVFNKGLELFAWVGDRVPKISSLILQKISESTGSEPSLFIGKIVTLLLFSLAIFFSSKITNKIAKYTTLVLSLILIFSVLLSFF